MKTWDTISNTWKLNTLAEYYYNASGKTTARLYKSWDELKNVWVNATKESYSYDGSIVVSMLQFWDAGINAWTNYYRIVDTLDANGKDVGAIFSLFFDKWTVVSRNSYTYDVSGLLLQKMLLTVICFLYNNF